MESSPRPSVAIVATLDTKGEEVGYLKELIEDHGCSTLIIDVGTLNPPTIAPDIDREQVFRAAHPNSPLRLADADRPSAVAAVIDGGAAIVRDLYGRGEIAGAISLGGGTGTHIGAGVMRSLPLGVPKVMVSTVASRDMSTVVGTKDMVVLHSVLDILGLNPLSKKVLANAAAAIAGMALNQAEIPADKPIVGLTSFGFITEGAMRVKALLESSGYDVAPFHANGTGGMAMEGLIEEGRIHGVVDFALHEFSDALYGGYCGGIGPGRLEAAGRKGIPQVVVPGGLDCIVLEFDSHETMPAAVRGRKVFWYDFRSGVRTSLDDVRTLARIISDKLNRSLGPVCVAIPTLGLSEADSPDGPLYEPETDAALVEELVSRLNGNIIVEQVNAHINDAAFCEFVVKRLDELMKGQSEA